LNIEQVRVGAPVTMAFDALPGVELRGHITHITPFGEVRQGDITYTAVIEPERHDTRLRWNMTATVSILP
jgi:HlyD family secretion protein